MSDAQPSVASPPAVLTVNYAKEKGEGIVYGGILIAGVLILHAITRAPTVATIGALVVLYGALYHWPFVRRDRRAMEISPGGLVIDRLGRLPWNAIAGADVVDRYLRAIRNAELQIELRRPLESAIENPAQVHPLRRLMYRCWRSTGPQQITVKLNTLDTAPELIRAVILQYVGRAA
ncbi:hypothetical protein [uncultured Parvibaculum sp.]|uniref:hypothetical protein n=1 Tax=uncultured Parvibaculum sp. TaxID=291828 RepID=UPI0030D997E0